MKRDAGKPHEAGASGFAKCRVGVTVRVPGALLAHWGEDVHAVEWEDELSRRRRRADHVDDLLRPGRDFASRKRRRADLMKLETVRDLALVDRERSAEETLRAVEAFTK